MKNLNTLAKLYGSDKTDTHHAYTYLYDLIFYEYRDQPINFLEIGLAVGGPELGGPVDRRVPSPSIQMWLEYFSRAHIYGFDISDFSHHVHPRFTFVRGDCGHQEDLTRVADRTPFFDVVIDDASHASAHQQHAFKVLFPRVARGGLYIIEDLHWQSPYFEEATPDVPKTAAFFAKFLREGVYMDNPILTESEMVRFRDNLHSFSIFPDFQSGSGIKLMVFRVR
jgi:hypothetical protein